MRGTLALFQKLKPNCGLRSAVSLVIVRYFASEVPDTIRDPTLHLLIKFSLKRNVDHR